MATAPEAVVDTDPETQKPRRWKKIKGGEHRFSTESSTPLSYGDLIDDDGNEQSAKGKRSYRDTVTGETADSLPKEDAAKGSDEDNLEYTKEMFDGRIVVEEKLIGKHQCPVFTLSKWEESRIQKPWRKGLIVSLLGRKIGFKALESRLNQLWVSAGVLNIIDLGHDFYLVTFTSDADRDYALGQGPWMIYDHYLTVREWTPNFQPAQAKIDAIAVWVRFSGLPIEYYDPAFLHFVGNRIGKTIKVDKTTMQHDRGKYARLCVEIDLNKSLLAAFEVKGKVYKIEYEGLHMLCLNCGRFGHSKEACTVVEEQVVKEHPSHDTESASAEDTSLWTVVQKYRPNVKKKQTQIKMDTSKQGQSRGSRFTVLQKETTASPAQVHKPSRSDTMGEKSGGIEGQDNGNMTDNTKINQANISNMNESASVSKENNFVSNEEIDLEKGATDLPNLDMQVENGVIFRGNNKDNVQSKGNSGVTKETQNFARYEDWITVDEKGQVHIHSQEILTNVNNARRVAQGVLHPIEETHSQSQPPKPPDIGDIARHDPTKVQSNEIIMLQANDEERGVIPTEHISDLVMEHLDDPNATQSL